LDVLVDQDGVPVWVDDREARRACRRVSGCVVDGFDILCLQLLDQLSNIGELVDGFPEARPTRIERQVFDSNSP
jgi:hypothetical protein